MFLYEKFKKPLVKELMAIRNLTEEEKEKIKKMLKKNLSSNPLVKDIY